MVNILNFLPVTLAWTLLIEGIILLLFRFSLRKNWAPFIVVNTVTQVALYAFIIFISMDYRPFEIVIAAAEALLYAKLLKEHSVARRIAYALTANTASFVSGLLF